MKIKKKKLAFEIKHLRWFIKRLVFSINHNTDAIDRDLASCETSLNELHKRLTKVEAIHGD